MMRRLSFPVLLFLALPSWVLHNQAIGSSMDEQADFLCENLKLHPTFDYAERFSARFVAELPYHYLTEYLHGYALEFGPCESAKAERGEPAAPQAVTFTTSAGVRLSGWLSIDPVDGKISGFQIQRAQDPRNEFHTWEEATAALRGLGGSTSAYLTYFGKNAVWTASPEAPLAVASSFKLFVLGALWQKITTAQEKWAWSTPLAIREEWKSLPSGEMRNWPAGAQVSVYEYARKMISESDNTATDHLILSLGRENVEKMLPQMGVQSRHPGNLPLLTTLEMFKLKWLPEEKWAAAFLEADTTGRRRLLEELAQVPRQQICMDISCISSPQQIETLEWFASTEELCRAMTWLAERGDAHVREILSLNQGLAAAMPHHPWTFVGFKGGSEPGVLHLTHFFETAGGDRGCLSLGWNDPTVGAYLGSAKQARLFNLVEKILTIAARAR